ncbi:hypothetical protein [Metabacillus niabensis]|uniref:DUF159 family protein n=1 Tax=Metabacillus niabensis TaxID=324854 RepID=A0ABT9YZL4_9BACI|nr:hypothetical protein [Metabacillus niabensis]MDQ0225169.1 hypothetical protein [Metabacillus niabensis]
MCGNVKTWYMTEEERLAYIKKHPIKLTEKPKGASFSDVQYVSTHRKRQELRKTNETAQGYFIKPCT